MYLDIRCVAVWLCLDRAEERVTGYHLFHSEWAHEWISNCQRGSCRMLGWEETRSCHLLNKPLE